MIKRYIWEFLSFIKASVLASYVYICFGRILNPYVIHAMSYAVFMLFCCWDRFHSVDLRMGPFGNFGLFYLPTYACYVVLSLLGFSKVPAELYNYAFYPLRTLEMFGEINTFESILYLHVIHVVISFATIFLGWVLNNIWMVKDMEEQEEYKVSEEMIEYVNGKMGDQYKK